MSEYLTGIEDIPSNDNAGRVVLTNTPRPRAPRKDKGTTRAVAVQGPVRSALELIAALEENCAVLTFMTATDKDNNAIQMTINRQSVIAAELRRAVAKEKA